MAGTKLSAAEIGKRARALMLAAQYLDENCMDTIPEAPRWASDNIKKQAQKLYVECGRRQAIRAARGLPVE